MLRRMKLLSGGMALLILAAVVVTGCGPEATPEAPASSPAGATSEPAIATSPPATATPPPATAEPTVFRVAIRNDPASLEPGLALELYTSWIAENLHVGLFYYDADSSLKPYALEDYEVSDDGKSYTFNLRDDVTFHNGRQLVADDFKYGWERYLDPDVGSAAGADYLGNIEGAQAVIEGETEELAGVDVVDDQTFVVRLAEVDPLFHLKLATTPTWIVPPEAVVDGAPEW
ncbi:MAG: ABC transporter substrate-binding protein, partial [Chloroflexota bacterium]